MGFLLDAALRELALRQCLAGELQEIDDLAVQLPRLRGHTATAQQCHAGSADMGTATVGRGQAAQIGYDLQHLLRVERRRTHVELQALGGPAEPREPQQHADFRFIRALEDRRLGVEAQ